VHLVEPTYAYRPRSSCILFGSIEYHLEITDFVSSSGRISV
jgi:hypothetical protein